MLDLKLAHLGRLFGGGLAASEPSIGSRADREKDALLRIGWRVTRHPYKLAFKQQQPQRLNDQAPFHARVLVRAPW